MRILFVFLTLALTVTASAQDITHQLGNNDGSSSFFINNSDGDNQFIVADDGSIVGTGSLIMPIKLVNADYTITRGDYTILVDASANNVTITFPTDLQVSGPIINLKRVDEANQFDVFLTDGNTTIDFNLKRGGAVLQYFLDPNGTPPDGYTGWWAIDSFGTIIEPTEGK